MRAQVIFESIYGNTEAIARAIADGLTTTCTVELVPVGEAPASVSPDIDLIVAGGPTHEFGLTRAQTRADAVKDATRPAATVWCGLREWLAELAPPTSPTSFATFDTRMHKPPLPGSAARGAARRLQRLGFVAADHPTSFWVSHATGPLADGELERARAWGASLPSKVQRPGRVTRPRSVRGRRRRETVWAPQPG